MSDLISRQDAIDTVTKHYRAHDNDLLEVIAYEIKQLPSAQPQRQTGKWIHIRTEADGNALYECSECHMGEVHVPIVEVSYCWHCGAKMEVEHEID